MKFFYDTEFIERPCTIDLISIGMVSEDGREFYAISNEFDETKANDWVKENVLDKLPPRNDPLWMSRAEIGCRLLAFIQPEKHDVELWGYYADYDHVALCWLFGPMIDLPKGMPMFTHDVKQWCQQVGNPFLPTQTVGAHNALADARWTKEAFEFLYSRQVELATNTSEG